MFFLSSILFAWLVFPWYAALPMMLAILFGMHGARLRVPPPRVALPDGSCGPDLALCTVEWMSLWVCVAETLGTALVARFSPDPLSLTPFPADVPRPALAS